MTETLARPVTRSEGSKRSFRKEGEDTKNETDGNCDSGENPLTWGESPGDGPVSTKKQET